MGKRALWPVLGLVGLFATGCPLPPPPLAPFDTTGMYEGTWMGQDTTTKQLITCDLELSLTQNVNANFPGNFGVNGTAIVDFACTDLGALLTENEQPTTQTIEVGGIQTTDGMLGLLSGNCPPGFCIFLGLNGPGEDTDDDGFMDVYSGDWTLTILPPGAEQIVFEGDFEVMEVEEAP